MTENSTTAVGSTEESGKTFTQAEMDSIIEGRLAREKQKYADYENLKEKAGKYDELQEAQKSELQKATEQTEALKKELDQLKNANKLKDIREKVAKETNVPVELLTGNDEESCKEQASAILKFAKPKNYPGTKQNGRQTTAQTESDAAMREFARQLFGKGE